MNEISLPKVTIGLILYKGEKYLPFSLTSLVQQDYQNIEFLFRDQSPNGEAYDFIIKNLPEVAAKVQLEKGENLWHSGGHNLLINRSNSEYYISASYDMVYPTDFVSKIVAELEKPQNQKYGSATCKLMRWEFSSAITPAASEDLIKSQSNFIDSVGIGMTKSHYFFDLGQGQEDKGQFDHLHDVFGTSGALAIFRKKALQEITYTQRAHGPGRQSPTLPGPANDKQYFDELIHYKNDIELAYRLQWAGWPCLLIPHVKVWHDRQAESEGKSSSMLLNILKSRKNKADWVKENSFFGHLVVLAKNYHRRGFSINVRLRTSFMNLLKYCYISLFERNLLQQYKKLHEHQAEIEAKTAAMVIKAKPIDLEKLMSCKN